MITIQDFKAMKMEDKLKYAKWISKSATTNSCSKETIRYILKWLIEYCDIATDLFEDVQE